jgi:glycosyltransferase involved in cell wall biosynthesis
MRVLFLTLYPESGASSRYRVLQFVPYLQEHGVECTVAAPFTEEEFARLRSDAASGRAWRYHAHEYRTRMKQIFSARRFDVVVLQKAVMSAYIKGMARLVRANARRLVYDIDDAVNLAPPHALPRRWAWIGQPGQINKLFASADLVLAGNHWLKESAEAAGGRAEWFPTVVDTDRFAPDRAANTPKFTVGWIGGPSTSAHLRPIADVLSHLNDARIRLVGADRVQAGVEGAEYTNWSLVTEVAEIQRFSVGVMPLPKTEWARGKCALKALQYMACGVPCVATPFGATLDIIEDGVSGMFADAHSEWSAAIERLRDPVFRKRLGDAGRRTVEERFSLRVAAPGLRRLLESVAR